jgi:hypothetical protein
MYFMKSSIYEKKWIVSKGITEQENIYKGGSYHLNQIDLRKSQLKSLYAYSSLLSTYILIK